MNKTHSSRFDKLTTSIKEQFPTLEDLMLKNKEAQKRDKKKKSFKRYKQNYPIRGTDEDLH